MGQHEFEQLKRMHGEMPGEAMQLSFYLTSVLNLPDTLRVGRVSCCMTFVSLLSRRRSLALWLRRRPS
jgi:hypothetical protein